MEKQKLIEQIHEILQNTQTEWQIDGYRGKHIDTLADPVIFFNNRKLATELIHLIGEDLINYLVNEGYIPSKLESLVRGEEPTEYTKAIGLVPSCKCRQCGGIAYKVGERFHCGECGNIFTENICPICNSEMNKNEYQEVMLVKEKEFTPFWTCPECHYHTEASR